MNQLAERVRPKEAVLLEVEAELPFGDGQIAVEPFVIVQPQTAEESVPLQVVQQVGANVGLLTREELEEYLITAPKDYKTRKI